MPRYAPVEHSIAEGGTALAPHAYHSATCTPISPLIEPPIRRLQYRTFADLLNLEFTKRTCQLTHKDAISS